MWTSTNVQAIRVKTAVHVQTVVMPTNVHVQMDSTATIARKMRMNVAQVHVKMARRVLTQVQMDLLSTFHMNVSV
jgi:hypothetical protein